MNSPALNPITRRLQRLEGLWNEFIALPDARVIRWLVDDDERQLLQTLIDLQSEPDPPSGIPDLWIEFPVPFNTRAEYSADLVGFLGELYAADRNAIAAAGITASWRPPSAGGSKSCRDVVQMLKSFQDAHEALTEHVVAVLNPETVLQSAEYLHWLLELAAEAIPASVRFMVLDSVRTPGLSGLAERYPALVHTVEPRLGMAGAYEQIVSEASGDGPGHDFRKYFVALTNAAGAGDIQRATVVASKAIEIANAQQWFYLVGATQMALGAAYFARKQLDETLQCYRAANAAIAGRPDDASQKLEIPTRMATGSVLIAAGRYGEAAVAFEDAAMKAVELKDLNSELECWRMAGWCYEQAGRVEESWVCGERSLDAGQKLDAEPRRMSNLSFSGQMLLRLTEKGAYRRRRSEIENRMADLLGPDWSAAMVQGAG
jgi:tetratricopeptide (TPR) repeat protein